MEAFGFGKMLLDEEVEPGWGESRAEAEREA